MHIPGHDLLVESYTVSSKAVPGPVNGEVSVSTSFTSCSCSLLSLHCFIHNADELKEQKTQRKRGADLLYVVYFRSFVTVIES
jgi:hypothetical protein